MSEIRLHRMKIFGFFILASLASVAHGLGVSSWRVRADAYVASTSAAAQESVKRIVTTLHDAQSRDDISACIKSMECVKRDADSQYQALGVKAASILCEYTRQHILTMVRKIDAQIEFLEYRKTHPATMLLYRLPTTWHVKKTNYELQNDINALHDRKKNYLQMLGNLILDLESFPQTVSANESAAWVSRVIGTISGQPMPPLTSTEQLVTALKRALIAVDNEQKVNNMLTRDGMISNRIEMGSNWMLRAGIFSGIALITGFGYLFGCHVTEGAQAVLAEQDKAFEDKFKAVVNELAPHQRSASLSAESSPQFGTPASSASSSQEGSGREQDSPRALVEPDMNLRSSSSASPAASSSSSPLGVGVFAKLKKVAGEKIDQAAQRIDQLTSSVPDKSKAPEPAASSSCPPKQPQTMPGKIANGMVEGVLQNPEIKAGVSNFNKILEKVILKLDGLTGEAIYNGAVEARKTLRLVISNELLAKAGPALSGSSLVAGLAATAYYIKRIASKHGKVYTAMKQGMLDISYMLASYDQQNQTVTAYDLGNLIYIGSRLNEHASAVLSHEESQLLASDIAQLQSPSISIANKSKLVQRMYMMYSFLVPPRAIII